MPSINEQSRPSNIPMYYKYTIVSRYFGAHVLFSNTIPFNFIALIGYYTLLLCDKAYCDPLPMLLKQL